MLLLLMVPALAGCLSGDGGGGGGGLFNRNEDHGLMPTAHPMPFGGDHDHADANQHRFAENARLVDHDDLQRFWGDEDDIQHHLDLGYVVGAHAMDVHGDRLVVAVFGNHDDTGGQQGFHLFDISDPESMVHLAFHRAGTAVGGDRTIAFGPNGDYVFLGFEGGARPGIQAVDVRNPSNVHEVAFWSDPTGYGPHTVAAGEIDGVTHVFALVFGVTILSFEDEQFTEVSRFATADEFAVTDAAQFIDPTDPGNQYFTSYALRSVYAHDTNFYYDPVTEKPLLLVAYAYDGMKVLDLSNPQFPTMIGRWLPPQDTAHKHYTHSVNAERMETGELIIVVGTETFEEENQQLPSPVWILDGTAMVAADAQIDESGFAEPEYLGTWTNPDNAPAGELTSSVHFFRQQDGLLYLSHYHGGVWVIDLRTDADRVRPEHVAYIMPITRNTVVPPEDCCVGFPLAAVPMVFDVAVDRNGVVYAADIIQGVSSIAIELDE